MGRPKKDSRSLNVHIDVNAYNQLEFIAEHLGQTKTVAVERAILEYASKYQQNNEIEEQKEC
jgi:hypothetical protein